MIPLIGTATISFDATYIIAAFIALLGSSGLSTFLAQRNARRAERREKDASKRREAELDAQKEVQEAAAAASEAARKLIETARGTNARLKQLQATADNTHAIVNSDRTKMLESLAIALEYIAKLLPKDKAAREAAKVARAEAIKSAKAADTIKGNPE